MTVALLTAFAPGAYAQLLSPGKLLRAHADLEGVRNCTKCHQLGERGVANVKCLDCHSLLKTRIDARQGFHATVADRNCAECHKDHFGTDFDAIRLDAVTFDHAKTGFTLAGGHTDAECRACHAAEYVTDAEVRRVVGGHNRLNATFLGLGTTCVTCHRKDDPHGTQFGTRSCEECHAEVDWTQPDRFDHAKTRYPLRGAHDSVQCRSCHAPIPGQRGALQLTGLSFGTCAACHAEDDPHRGQFAGRRCEECHSEKDWKRPDRFDHTATRYPLTGRHREVRCQECHQPTSRNEPVRFRGLEFGTCTACHADDDPHAGRLGTNCTECHATDGWRPRGGTQFERTFDHARTRFPLAGKHAAAPCAACHRPDRAKTRELALTFVPATRTRAYPVPVAEQCGSCHVDYHPGAFRDRPGGSECRSCHGEDGWSPTAYDIAHHNRDAGYELTGAHLAAPCMACHKNPALGQTTLQFRIPRQECLACHQTLDPHGGQFGDRACDACHATETFKIADFDHSRTRYPLDGKHRTVPCASCHPSVTGPDGRAVRTYRPLGTACRDCHAEGQG